MPRGRWFLRICVWRELKILRPWLGFLLFCHILPIWISHHQSRLHLQSLFLFRDYYACLSSYMSGERVIYHSRRQAASLLVLLQSHLSIRMLSPQVTIFLTRYLRFVRSPYINSADLLHRYLLKSLMQDWVLFDFRMSFVWSPLTSPPRFPKMPYPTILQFDPPSLSNLSIDLIGGI